MRWSFYDHAGQLVREVVAEEVPHGLIPAGRPMPLAALFLAPDDGGYYLATWRLGSVNP